MPKIVVYEVFDMGEEKVMDSLTSEKEKGKIKRRTIWIMKEPFISLPSTSISKTNNKECDTFLQIILNESTNYFVI